MQRPPQLSQYRNNVSINNNKSKNISTKMTKFKAIKVKQTIMLCVFLLAAKKTPFG